MAGHKSSHAYKVVQSLGFPLYHPGWRVSGLKYGLLGIDEMKLWASPGLVWGDAGGSNGVRSAAALLPMRAPCAAMELSVCIRSRAGACCPAAALDIVSTACLLAARLPALPPLPLLLPQSW